MNSTLISSQDADGDASLRSQATTVADALEGADAAVPKKDVDPRMHSGEHLLTATVMAMLGCGRPFTTHLEKKKSKADYRFARELAPEEVREIERRVNAVVATDALLVLTQRCGRGVARIAELVARIGSGVQD